MPAACCSLEIEGDEQERLINMFRALGNPIRFDILKFLLTHPGCITGDLVRHLPLAQSTVSQHLKVLKSAGWISGIVQGPATCYCIDDASRRWFVSKVGEIF